ncbi:MAG: hypothetical protein UX85_C0001G0035 [Candidatus Beckwithbacteria bacterium GW2011_GWB1_47_15]|uniref:Triosephosphate isomerase n=1 Tax=Candidatus Beckwithbacteria bacterium GW2011_GWB1_47_15 TaxID=1618371 RepID=A0A0G1RXH9_9BACT|nr:MAG: hypothetical protein UY43_C0001G1094 [Candidatus Beckwithbacteria bacterium GW2011_GWC1_49_16]AQS30669.1 hypothetical protein [uncultured bacterium]KKU35857.1 MAG: hypothetical protein UX50_C0001G0034 [Candidatus Beckwithbacteria bacterium GW2011_GWA1_46_30]KKU61821.1 MAG: hypothetical protein UX85_C0001G0035 [Candidatus Beckwithbacteria bacterium GW2011_GWB1_47_15]KKU72625.1 MAG: hypothetical protein UX97_C0001G0495 [Candidatus Beckwithbacteria bacterium GW2011_GWA2_47_25]KKW04207.1 M
MAKFILSAQNFDIYEGDNLDPYARTGDVSLEQIASAGAQGVIIGHSEVGDNPQIIRQKLIYLEAKQKQLGLEFLSKTTVLLGESWEEFADKAETEVALTVGQKTAQIFKDIPESSLEGLVIGYEPKWGSRGSGRDDMPPPASKLISACAKAIKRQIPVETPIIYGGRSTPERTEEILKDDDVSGLILGSACNSVKKTMDIARAMSQVKGKKPKVLHANFKAYQLANSYFDYLKALRKLDNSFTIYLSPPHTDIYQLGLLLRKNA